MLSSPQYLLAKNIFRFDDWNVQFGFIVINRTVEEKPLCALPSSNGELFTEALQVDKTLGNTSSQLEDRSVYVFERQG